MKDRTDRKAPLYGLAYYGLRDEDLMCLVDVIIFVILGSCIFSLALVAPITTLRIVLELFGYTVPEDLCFNCMTYVLVLGMMWCGGYVLMGSFITWLRGR